MADPAGGARDAPTSRNCRGRKNYVQSIKFLNLYPSDIDVFVSRGSFLFYADGDIESPILMEREWDREPFHFDDVSNGMLTLFTVATFEGWPTSVSCFLIGPLQSVGSRLIGPYELVSCLLIGPYELVS